MFLGVSFPILLLLIVSGNLHFLINILHKSFEMLIFVLQLTVVSFWLLD